MARGIAGFTVERVRLTVNATGSVSPAECAVNPTGCCDPDAAPPPVGEIVCCPGMDQLASTGAVAIGPIGIGGDICEIDVSLEIDPADRLTWAGDAAGSGGVSCALTSMAMKLFCAVVEEAGSTWRAAGEWTDGTGGLHRFDIDLEDDGEHLTGALIVPGQEEPLLLVIDRPCTTPHSLNCVDGKCVSVLGAGGEYETRAACLAACGITVVGGETCTTATLLPSDDADYALPVPTDGSTSYYYIDLPVGSTYYAIQHGTYTTQNVNIYDAQTDCCSFLGFQWAIFAAVGIGTAPCVTTTILHGRVCIRVVGDSEAASTAHFGIHPGDGECPP